MDFKGLCVVVRSHLMIPKAQQAFPGALVLAPHGAKTGHRFESIVFLEWHPESETDHRWVDEGLKTGLGPGCNANVFYLP